MRIDYDSLADSYDKYRRGGGPYINRLIALARDVAAKHVLELGAGTGNNTAAFLDACPGVPTVCIEPSAGMLAKGRKKNLPVSWVRGDALHQPLATETFDFLFAVYMLHHIESLDSLFAECRRVLRSGCAVFVTTTHDFIRRHPMNAYFPSFAAVDTARFQDLPEIRTSLSAAGFANVESEVCVAEPAPVDAAYVERVAGRFISTYGLLPPGEYESGLARLQDDVARAGTLPEPIAWESAVVWGRV